MVGSGAAVGALQACLLFVRTVSVRWMSDRASERVSNGTSDTHSDPILRLRCGDGDFLFIFAIDPYARDGLDECDE